MAQLNPNLSLLCPHSVINLDVVIDETFPEGYLADYGTIFLTF